MENAADFENSLKRRLENQKWEDPGENFKITAPSAPLFCWKMAEWAATFPTAFRRGSRNVNQPDPTAASRCGDH